MHMTLGFQKVLLAMASAKVAHAQYWTPPAGTSFFIQLSQQFDATQDLNRTAYDLDLFDNAQSTFDTLKGDGRASICYFSAGSYEDWRIDKGNFSRADYGNGLEGWPGEYWFDTRRASVRAGMEWRLDQAVAKGCMAVDPDNIDAYNNDNGLGLTEDDAVDFVKFLADAAHSRGLAVGLKNGGDILERVLADVQFSVNEQCEEFNECDTYRPFIAANKPVFHIEYPPNQTAETIGAICGDRTASGFTTVIKDLDLDAAALDCPLA